LAGRINSMHDAYPSLCQECNPPQLAYRFATVWFPANALVGWCAGGDLVRSDAITWLRCAGGTVEAARPDGTVVRVAGPGCPPGFEVALLRALESGGILHDARWAVIISAEITAGTARWVIARLDELGAANGPGS
jgi:hypothetical protein